MNTTPTKTRSRTGCLTCRKRKKKCDELLYPECQNCQRKNLECTWPPLKHELHKKMEDVKYINDEMNQEVRHNPKKGNKDVLRNSINRHHHHTFPSYNPNSINSHSYTMNVDSSKDPTISPSFPKLSNNPGATYIGPPNGYTSDSIIVRPKSVRVAKPTYPDSVKHVLPPAKSHPKRHSYILERIAMQEDIADEDIADEASLAPVDMYVGSNKLLDTFTTLLKEEDMNYFDNPLETLSESSTDHLNIHNQHL